MEIQDGSAVAAAVTCWRPSPGARRHRVTGPWTPGHEQPGHRRAGPRAVAGTSSGAQPLLAQPGLAAVCHRVSTRRVCCPPGALLLDDWADRHSLQDGYDQHAACCGELSDDLSAALLRFSLAAAPDGSQWRCWCGRQRHPEGLTAVAAADQGGQLQRHAHGARAALSLLHWRR